MMIRRISTRSALNLGVAALALLATPALAQDAPAGDAAAITDDDSGEVVVTARRREETLLDVPIAITAYSGAALERSGAIDIEMLIEAWQLLIDRYPSLSRIIVRMFSPMPRIVASSWRFIITEPSPARQITRRCGAAMAAPIAQGRS